MTIIDFDKRIKKLREQKGLSQKELADRLYVTRAAVNAWEMGNAMPSIDKLIDLSRFFHVSTDYLLGIDHKISIDITNLDDPGKELIQRMLYYMDVLKPELTDKPSTSESNINKSKHDSLGSYKNKSHDKK